jgi:hypothetical protein
MSFDLYKQMNELNITGGGVSYETPKFTGQVDPDDLDDDYELVDNNKNGKDGEQNHKDGSDSFFKEFAKSIYGLNEQTYKQYKQDNSITDRRKLNVNISNINGKLQEIERILDHNIRLKKDKSLSNGDVWKTTKMSLSKVDKRIMRIQAKLIKLMA